MFFLSSVSVSQWVRASIAGNDSVMVDRSPLDITTIKSQNKCLVLIACAAL